jgi:hypothetical protein
VINVTGQLLLHDFAIAFDAKATVNFGNYPFDLDEGREMGNYRSLGILR